MFIESNDMHPEHIKAEIRIKGITSKQVAVDLGLCHSTVSNVIHGRGTSARVKQHIAALISVPVNEIWPVRVTGVLGG